jgi:hypothetical protein
MTSIKRHIDELERSIARPALTALREASDRLLARADSLMYAEKRVRA